MEGGSFGDKDSRWIVKPEKKTKTKTKINIKYKLLKCHIIK
jgi:hypothetical protein